MYSLSKPDVGKLSFIYNRNISFYIGFESPIHARHVQYNINPLRYNFRIKLSPEGKNKHHLTDYVKMGKPLYLDTQALLSIDKKNEKQRTYQKMLCQELTYMINMETIDAHDFVTLPFVSQKNIVLPKSVQYEDIHQIVFNSIAIYQEPETIEEIKEHLERFSL